VQWIALLWETAEAAAFLVGGEFLTVAGVISWALMGLGGRIPIKTRRFCCRVGYLW